MLNDSEPMLLRMERLESNMDSEAPAMRAPASWESLEALDEPGPRSLARAVLSKTLTAVIVFVAVLAPCLLFSPGSQPSRWPEFLLHQLAMARREIVGSGVAPPDSATTKASVRPLLFGNEAESYRVALPPAQNLGAASANQPASVENAEEKDELGDGKVSLQHIDEGVEWNSPAEQEPQMIGSEEQEPIIKKRVQGQMEWEVVFGSTPVKVRSWKDLSSKVLGTQKKGDVIVGKRDGWWVKMLNRQGYIKQAIVDPPATLLKQREVAYAQLIVGNCADAGMYPIHDLSICHAAGMELGHHHPGGIKVYSGSDTRPEGCYVLRDGEMWVSNHPVNRGRGASRLRKPVCSSRPPETERV